jgi:NAD(P)-dependent dehydrogenase (short-subunit alcohol dehydrogenase family)
MESKVALVTGGGRGIGRGIVIALAKAGWQVAFSYRGNTEAAQATLAEIVAAGGEGLAVQADGSSTADRAKLVGAVLEQFGGIDLLVNNAGMAPRVRNDLLEMSEASYDEVMETNLKGAFFLTQHVARVMVEQQRAEPDKMPVIINIGSISSDTSSTNRGEYCISKAGMSMMTLLFADRLAAEGIRVYEVRPGIIETDMTAGVKAKYDKSIAEGLLPIRRWGQPEDVARAVVALAEGVLPYSTGEVIHVDGGFHIRRL